MKHTAATTDEEAGTDPSPKPTDRFAKEVIPYYFSDVARQRGDALKVGDYVRVRGSDKKYQLEEIYWEYRDVRVRDANGVECLGLPWHLVSPWKRDVIKSTTITRAIGDWLFAGNRVYRLSEPNRVLKQRQIHWDRQTCDVEDEDGQVFYDVSWDSLEFWDTVDYHLPDE